MTSPGVGLAAVSFVGFVWWIFASAVVAGLAIDKGRSGIGWFLIAFFSSPVVGLIAVAAASDLAARRETTAAYGDMKAGFEAVLNALEVQRQALVARLPPLVSPPPALPARGPTAPLPPASSKGSTPGDTGWCSTCGKLRARSVARCIYCGNEELLASKPGRFGG